jgi:hypothetical protein
MKKERKNKEIQAKVSLQKKVEEDRKGVEVLEKHTF